MQSYVPSESLARQGISKAVPKTVPVVVPVETRPLTTTERLQDDRPFFMAAYTGRDTSRECEP
jgi:hypothetical protein